jgi:hypothetical protein
MVYISVCKDIDFIVIMNVYVIISTYLLAKHKKSFGWNIDVKYKLVNVVLSI